MHALLIAESTPKLMRLASFARTVVPEIHWQTITTGAFTRAVERFDTRTMRVTFKSKHRQHVNRIVALATDVDVVWIATDPTPKGELLAADVAEHILERYPDRQIRRLLIDQMTSQAFRQAYDVYDTINTKKADSMRVSRVINFLINSRIKALTGRASGRAVLPVASQIRAMERPGEARIRVRLGSGVCFTSQFAPEATVKRAFEHLTSEVPYFLLETAPTIIEPPRLYDAWRLQADGCRVLGARAIEVASQTEQLYHAGYIARDHRLDDRYIEVAREELAAFADVPADTQPECLVGIVPTNLRCLPSDVPKPVRPVYRVVWANTLCAFGRAMPATRETASFILCDVRFTADSYVPREPGFDHASFGLFYRRGHIGNSRLIEEARMFGSGPFEHEVIRDLDIQLVNPALVLKAAENIGYIGFDGPEVTLLEVGDFVLDTVEEHVPQLLDHHLFDSIERFLVSDFDPNELIEPWSRWAESVSNASKKKKTAYLI